MGLLRQLATTFSKQDNYLFGGLFALVFSVVCFAVFYGLNGLIAKSFHLGMLPVGRVIIAAIAMNLIPMRFFFVSLKLEKLARGVLAVTVVLALLFFIFIHTQRIPVPN